MKKVTKKVKKLAETTNIGKNPYMDRDSIAALVKDVKFNSTFGDPFPSFNGHILQAYIFLECPEEDHFIFMKIKPQTFESIWAYIRLKFNRRDFHQMEDMAWDLIDYVVKPSVRKGLRNCQDECIDAYFLQTTKRRCWAFINKQRSQFFQLKELVQTGTEAAISMEKIFDNKDLVKKVEELLKNKPHYFKILKMDAEGFNKKEIGKTLNLPENEFHKIREYRYRAKKIIKESGILN